jgi:Uma2 family endonuclease
MVVQKKTYTYPEYAAFQALPENADRIFELIEGEIVAKMPSFEPSNIASRINRRVGTFAEDEHDLGYMTTADGGFILSDEDTFVPDVAYISRQRLPEKPRREVIGPPDLAVEVKSPTDSKRAMRRKAEKHLAYGTRLVWLVFPDEQEVEVYDARFEEVQNVGLNGTLDGGDVLPGFTLTVKDIFK